MTRAIVVSLLLLGGCVTHRPTPASYDFDSISAPASPPVRLRATITVPDIAAPGWLSTDALDYRLDYVTPARLMPYALSEWVAPPGQLLTLRLRELISAANDGFTLNRLGSDAAGYQLAVTLGQFVQVFSSPRTSRCIVALSATLSGPGGQVVAQRSFHAERQCPTGNAAGAVYGLVQASDADLERILTMASIQPPISGSRLREIVAGSEDLNPGMDERFGQFRTDRPIVVVHAKYPSSA